MALAGSVITTNVPTGTEIVNIDARADGAASSANNFSDWFQPFANDVSITLTPGTYTFGIVDPTDAVASFPTLTSAQLGTINGAWTYNSPWLTDYMVFDQSALNDSNQTQLFSGAVATQSFTNPADSYAAAKTGNYRDLLHISPGGRANGTLARSYTLTKTQTLLFAIPDQGVDDNAGGVSVVVTKFQATPEPAPFAAVAIGGWALLRRRRNGTIR